MEYIVDKTSIVREKTLPLGHRVLLLFKHKSNKNIINQPRMILMMSWGLNISSIEMSYTRKHNEFSDIIE
jgi:hypothetical protein